MIVSLSNLWAGKASLGEAITSLAVAPAMAREKEEEEAKAKAKADKKRKFLYRNLA